MLINLTLQDYNRDNDIHNFGIPFGQLKTLKFLNICEYSGLLQNLQEILATPVLRKIKFESSCHADDGIDGEALTLFSPSSLEYLSVNTYYTDTPHPELIIPKLPSLPTLKTLRLKAGHNGLFHPYLSLDPEKFNLNPVAFPALECVDIPFGIVLATLHIQSSRNKRRHPNISEPSVIFSNVIRLILRLEFASRYGPKGSVEPESLIHCSITSVPDLVSHLPSHILIFMQVLLR